MADTKNMRFWDQIKKPPADALKPITGGRMSGKTDINPQWRIQAMTELFGPIGIGWTYRIVRTWTEQGRLVPKKPNELTEQHEIVACAEVALKYNYDAPKGEGNADGRRWTEEIPGLGGHMLVVSESSGFHTNDECYKMAITDALSVAMKQLGMAADIYRGLFDGKYGTQAGGGEQQEEFRPRTGGLKHNFKK